MLPYIAHLCPNNGQWSCTFVTSYGMLVSRDRMIRDSLTVTATELKQNFGKYMSHVKSARRVVITKNGTKTAS